MSQSLANAFVTNNLRVKNMTHGECLVYYVGADKKKKAVCVEAGTIKDLTMFARARAFDGQNLAKLLKERKLKLV